MDPQTHERWIEIQFYYACIDILAINNEILDLFDLIEAFAALGHQDTETVKLLAQEALSTIRFRPSKEEFIAISWQFDMPAKNIKERLRVHNRTYYDIVNHEKQDPRMFYPRTDTDAVKHMYKFINIFNKLRKVGIKLEQTKTRRYNRNVRNIQRLRPRCYHAFTL